MTIGIRQQALGNSKKLKLFLYALCALLFALNVSAQAQQPKKIPRIGYLSNGTPASDSARADAIRLALRERGYIEGQNIVIEQRYAAGQSDKLPELVAEFVRIKADVRTGDPAAHAAKKATTAIPIVIVTSPDPVGTGLIASLAHPGGNVTGLSDFHGGVVTKRLELLKDVAPLASRIVVLLNPANPSNPIQLKDIQAAAPAFRVTLISLEVKGPDDIDPAFTTVVKERAGALLVLGDRLFATHQSQIIKFAVKNRLPTIYSQRLYVEAGGLMSYGANFTDQYRRAAIYVDKILKGAKPADLPVEQPRKFELVINLKAAKQIGLTIPPTVLARADRVIR
jgi:putative tryptophan/tyrosine transport system substrate-binding protein